MESWLGPSALFKPRNNQPLRLIAPLATPPAGPRHPASVSHMTGYPAAKKIKTGGANDTQRTATARGVSPGEPGESHAARCW